jgi:hypothetical protein
LHFRDDAVFERVAVAQHPTVARQTAFSELKDVKGEQQLTKLLAQQQYNV